MQSNETKFLALDQQRAEMVRQLQEALTYPSDNDFAHALEHNLIGNTPYNRREINIANKIYGPSMNSLKGKLTKRKSKLPREDEKSKLPSYIIENYQNIHIGIDIFFVNQMPFMFAFSKYIGLM